MQLVPLYRSVLKKLHATAYRRPHFLLELRFQLSRPVVGILLPGEKGITFPSSVNRSLQEEYMLDRDDTELMGLDPRDLYESCKADLHSSFSRDPSQLDKTVNLKDQIEAFRCLQWLQQRLERTLGDTTEKRAEMEIRVSKGPTEIDFIPDEDFTEDGKGIREGRGSPSMEEAEKKEGGAPVYSAGATGIRMELMVSRNFEKDYPLGKEFVRDFPPIQDRVRQEKEVSHAKLVELAHEYGPVEITTRNEDVTLTVKVSPFDPEYVNRLFADFGFFRNAHKQFTVQFSLSPLEKDQKIQIVNTYFCRLDTLNNETVEDIGFIDPLDFRFLIMQRDTPNGSFHDIWEELGLSEDGEVKDQPFKRDFELVFCNDSDGVHLMKGLIYYRIGNDIRHIQETPIRVISFSLVRLEP